MRYYQRGRVWWVDFGHVNGQRTRRSSQKTDRAEAEKWAQRQQARYWLQGPRDPDSVTWDDAVLAWLDKNPTKKSLTDDKDRLRWLSKHLRGHPLPTITTAMLEHAADAKGAEGSAPQTVNLHLAAASAVLNFARKRGWLEIVPHIPKRKVANAVIRWITPKEAASLLAELPEHLKAMARFTLATGLRQSNVSYLEWARVDLKRKVAWVNPDEAKAGRAIPVPLNADAIAILKEWRGRDPKWVFVWRGEPMAKCSTKAWYDALERAGIKDFRWHDLRHTWASWHAQGGTPLHALMELGGWRDYKMVLRYAHLAPEHLRQYADRLAQSTAHKKPTKKLSA